MQSNKKKTTLKSFLPQIKYHPAGNALDDTLLINVKNVLRQFSLFCFEPHTAVLWVLFGRFWHTFRTVDMPALLQRKIITLLQSQA